MFDAILIEDANICIISVHSFRASYPIEVLALAFYGPHNGIRSSYNIYVEVFKTPFPDEKWYNLHKEEIHNFEAAGEIFWVDFKRPVFIERNTWHRIEFRLDVRI